MRELSRVTEVFTESVIREMTRRCDAVGGHNLSQGFPDFPSCDAVKEAAVRAIGDDRNQYSVTFGERVLREAVSLKARRYNGIACNPETEVTITCGATEAMMSTMRALINPGDEVVIFEPFYENYGPDCVLSGATPRYVTLRSPDWTYDPAELAAAFGKRTKAIIINSPNNPTGKVFSLAELEEIAALCMKWDCYAVTDEIYEHILFDGAEHLSLASLEGMAERTVTINSVSKTYSVTGWRVGWAIASAAITARIRKVHDFTTVCAPNAFQHAAVTALAFPDEYYDGLRERYRAGREIVLAMLRDLGFHPFTPRGAYYIIADMSALMPQLDAADDVDFSRKLIERARVATVPGSAFYSQPESGRTQVRFCFCKKTETLRAVEGALRKALVT